MKATDIQKLVEYIMLNAYSVKSIGLYNGKVGLSLCLFEVARYLNDESIEEYAFGLLQESLALSSKSKNTGFESGLSGVGFGLLYLIKNQFIDANVEELFGEQIGRIQSLLKETNTFFEKHFSQIYFLRLYDPLQKNTEIQYSINKIIKAIEDSLTQQFSKFDLNLSDQIKVRTLDIFEDYLKMAVLYNDCRISDCLLNFYSQLFQKGKICSRLGVGFFLERVARHLQNEELMLVAETNKTLATANIYPHVLTLSQRINLLHLLGQEPDERYKPQIYLLEKDISDISNSKFGKNISQIIPYGHLTAGYGFGIAKLLLYWVYRINHLHHQDVSHFQYLF
ncbi:hypothetical protein FACS1894160_3220 [Bacteroidia bacterium]|nr:hypothetical protein FACS1894123_05330 [Bacteroidia bacterium]GHV08617.1 hypothetical protein FACS1894160_3220 [Bacteroidia bacterium]